MAVPRPVKPAPWERVPAADVADDGSPELVWLVDTTDGLDAFAPKPGKLRPAEAAALRPPSSAAPPDGVWAVNAADGLDAFAPEAPAPPGLAEMPLDGLADSGDDAFASRPPGVDRRAPRVWTTLVAVIVLAAAAAVWWNQPRAATPASARLATPASDAVAPAEPRATASVLLAQPRDPAPEPGVTAAAPPPAPVTIVEQPAATADTPRTDTVPPAPAVSMRAAAPAATVTEPPPTRAPAPASTDTPAAPTVALPPPGFVIDPLPVAPDPPASSAPPAATTATTASAAVTAPSTAAAPVAPAPVAVPPSSAAVMAATRDAESRAIENVLGRYRAAFNRLDAGAAAAVWPTVNAKNLARAFERLDEQQVSFERCTIDLSAARAEAACSGSARYVPKVGNRAPRAEARQWNFSLRKASGGWLIDRVDAR